MKKVSIITLSLVMLMNGSLVFSAPKRANRKRNVANNASPVKIFLSNGKVANSEDEALFLTYMEKMEKEKLKEMKLSATYMWELLDEYFEKKRNVANACSGIKKDLDTIFGLNVATTAVSGVGTLASGGALITGIVKANTDKKIKELSSKTSLELYEVSKNIEERSNEAEENKLEKKSKTLGNVRTGLMAGSIATSAVSTGTSIASSVNAKKLAEKMKDCNKAISQLQSFKKVIEGTYKAEEENLEESMKSTVLTYMKNMDEILDACKGYDNDNIKQLQTMSTVSAVVSGVGTATSVAGTITSFMANTKKVREDDSDNGEKKEKNLNLASNIMAGVTTATSGTSTVLSAVSIGKARKDSDMAKRCENILK